MREKNELVTALRGSNYIRVAEGLGFPVREGQAKLGNNRITLKCEQLLLATGVAPKSDDMGLELAGVEVSPRGFINVNEELRSSASPGNYSIPQYLTFYLIVNSQKKPIFNTPIHSVFSQCAFSMDCYYV